ncbi:unnamed protein product, partial [Discosporangium mesarthrocarpum]
EDDYLSAAFLSDDIGADLKGKGKERAKRGRLPDPDRGKVLSKKEIAQKMEERREEGLQQQLGRDNAGFKLLMKLGYKGGGLGKDGEGTSQPIAPVIKAGRAGLGKDSEIRRVQEEKKERAKAQQAWRVHREVERRKEFRSAMSLQFVDRRLQGELSKARRILEELDERVGMGRSVMWPDIQQEEGSAEGEGALQPQIMAKRGWETEATVAKPGNSAGADSGDDLDRPAVGQQPLAVQAKEGGSGGDPQEEWDAMELVEKLAACLEYLRCVHQFCLYCGCAYADEEDLASSCPGPSREDHDEEEM